MEESRNAYRVLVGRPGGKRPLGRPRCTWEAKIKMDVYLLYPVDKLQNLFIYDKITTKMVF